MVLVEDFRRLLDVPAFRRRRGPGQRHQPVDIGANNPDLGRGGRNALHPVDLFEGAFLDGIRHAGGLDLLSQIVEVGAFLVFAKFLADRLQLLAQDLLALQLADRALDFVLDLRLQFEDLDLLAEEECQQPQPFEDIGRFQHVLLLFQRVIGRGGIAHIISSDGPQTIVLQGGGLNSLELGSSDGLDTSSSMIFGTIAVSTISVVKQPSGKPAS